MQRAVKDEFEHKGSMSAILSSVIHLTIKGQNAKHKQRSVWRLYRNRDNIVIVNSLGHCNHVVKCDADSSTVNQQGGRITAESSAV